VYDFLLVINSNLDPFLRYSDLLAKITNFSYPLSFSAVAQCGFFKLMEKLYGS